MVCTSLVENAAVSRLVRWHSALFAQIVRCRCSSEETTTGEN
jgi:hypothetical protein